MINFKAWLREFRVRFLLFVSLPVLLGSAIAYVYYPELFSVPYLFLSVVAMLLLHAGTVIINDYFDFMSGADVLNKVRTPYSGGSGLLPEKVLKPSRVLLAGCICYALCILLGIFIVMFRSPTVLLIGAVGVGMGIAYTAPPFKLSYRGLGEIARLMATPLIVLGAFLVQVPVSTITGFFGIVNVFSVCIIASLPIAFFNTAALYIFEFPDYEADLQAGKMNLVVMMGTKSAAYMYVLMQIAAYISLIIAIVVDVIPWPASLVLLLVPASAYASLGLLKHNAEALRLLPYLKAASSIYIFASTILVLTFAMNL
ncbi:MAG TPA: prenyltransferase [Methanocella sp.]|nr:prenyltransferase [Methanocella sp.]